MTAPRAKYSELTLGKGSSLWESTQFPHRTVEKSAEAQSLDAGERGIVLHGNAPFLSHISRPRRINLTEHETDTYELGTLTAQYRPTSSAPWLRWA
ncbi:hypothetical protein SESBI_03578 [Sesbania bispinosa]|nr:hypothetical protein SESBI_03578 [Sesbania bispinosa]